MSQRQLRARETVRNWNRQFPPGTLVIFQGRERRTWAPAGLGARDMPSVFLDGEPDEAVPLDQLDVPGYTVVTGKKRTKERPEETG